MYTEYVLTYEDVKDKAVSQGEIQALLILMGVLLLISNGARLSLLKLSQHFEKVNHHAMIISEYYLPPTSEAQLLPMVYICHIEGTLDCSTGDTEASFIYLGTFM